MIGISLDTGALIALERNNKRMRDVLAAATARRVSVTASAAVIAEWWRAPSKRGDLILRAVEVEPLTDELARIAGQAQSAVRGATVVDAIVMASAAQRGDVVYTSDLEDLQRLQAYFPGVRVLRA